MTGDLREELSFYETTIIPAFNELFCDQLKMKAELRKYPSVGVCGVYVFDRNTVTYIKKKFNLIGGKKLKVRIPNFKTKDQKKHFLRGLYDTDGSIYFCKSNVKTKSPTFCNTFHYKPKIRVATISKDLMRYAYHTLRESGVSPHYYTPQRQRPNENIMYSVVLDRTEDVKKWINNIGFKSPKHKTKIKVWNKFGYCPPFTTLGQRVRILNGKIDPFDLMKPKKNNFIKQRPV